MKKNKRSRSFRRKTSWWLGGLVGVIGLVGASRLLLPYEWNHAWTRFQLWWGNVERVDAGGFWSLKKSNCDNPLGCACILLVHGEGDDATTWHNVLLWSDADWKKMGLDRRRKLLAVNLPGVGGTPRPADRSDYRSRKIAEHLQGAILEHCQNWIVVGNGLGGTVAAWLALLWPQGVSRLILMGSEGLESQRRTPGFFSEETAHARMRDYLTRAYFHPPHLSERLIDEMVVRAQQSDVRTMLAAQTEEDDLDLQLTTLLAPTLLLWGTADRITPIAEGRAMRTLLPSGMIREIKDCGHFIQKECPFSLIQALVDMSKHGAM